jgi:hypothetical protein
MNSIRYRISAAIVEALRAAPALAGVKVLDNPTDASALQAGERLVLVEDQTDRFIDQKNQQGKRRFAFTLGAINRSANDRAGADADYQAAEAAVRGTHKHLMSTLGCGPLHEEEVTFRVEGIDVGGALVLGTFSVEYLKSRPA